MTCGIGRVISVVLGRFYPVVGRGLQETLREDAGLTVIGSDLSCSDMERIVHQQVPQVAILDRRDEVVLRGRLTPGTRDTAIVVFACDPEPAYARMLLACGATCVSWNASAKEILEVIHLAASGARLFASADSARIERWWPADALPLTDRETQVLEHLSRDETYAEIALALEISAETVRRHTVSIRRKLGVASRGDLVGLPVPSRRAAT